MSYGIHGGHDRPVKRAATLTGKAPFIPAREPLILDFKEALVLPPSPSSSVTSFSGLARATDAEKSVTVLPPQYWPRPPSSQRQHHNLNNNHNNNNNNNNNSIHDNINNTPRVVPPVPSKPEMASTQHLRAQRQCLHLCSKTVSAGDSVAEKMAEYFSLVNHPPNSLVTLAGDLLQTCQLVSVIETGLRDAVSTAHTLPLDMIKVLDKRFGVAQADYRLIDRVVVKELEYETSGALGRMKRGLGKMFGDNHGLDKVASSLARAREDLEISSQLFVWNGEVNVMEETEYGMGYIGLSAALDAPQLAKTITKTSIPPRTDSVLPQIPDGYQASRNRSAAAVHQAEHSQSLPYNPPVPPKAGRDSVSQRSPRSMSEKSHFDAQESYRESPNTTYYSSPAISSLHGAHHHYSHEPAAPDARRSPSRGSPTRDDLHMGPEMDALVGDLAKRVFESSDKHLVDTKSSSKLPRRTPAKRFNASHSEQPGTSVALLTAIRARDHKLVAQLLEQGVASNAIGDLHPLNEALLAQDIESVRLLLMYGADPNKANHHGEGPLLVCAETSFLLGAMALLKYGADPNVLAAADMETPLTVAAIANNVQFTYLLLMHGAAPNHPTVEGNTILIGSINKKTPHRLVDMLLQYGADPNEKDREGKTALFQTIQSGRPDILLTLIQHGADPNLPGPKHMLWPATYQPECLKILLDHGADHKKTSGIMELAASINNIESIKVHLKAGVSPNAKKDGIYTPLCTSIRDNRTDIFQLLLENGADPNVPASEYPAFKCVTHHREHLLPALVAAGVDLRSPKGILEKAVASNNMDALKWLLDQGIAPDERSPEGHTPLTSAIRENRIEFVKVLLASGANPNIRGQDWPVCMAVRHPEILKRILAVLPDARAFKGVVEMAVVANQLESVKLLLAAGVSVEDRNGGVFSPLTTAIRERNHEIVEFLIGEGGADVNAPGEHLPIVKSLRRCQDNHTEIIDMLLDKGADPNKVYRGWNGIMQALENGDAVILEKICKKCGVDLKVKDELDRTVIEIAVSRRWEEAVSILLENPL